jgi:hypothetical protein
VFWKKFSSASAHLRKKMAADRQCCFCFDVICLGINFPNTLLKSKLLVRISWHDQINSCFHFISASLRMLRILFTFYRCVPIFKLVELLRKFLMAQGLLSKDSFNCSSHSVLIFISFVQNSLCIDLYSQNSQDAPNTTVY